MSGCFFGKVLEELPDFEAHIDLCVADASEGDKLLEYQVEGIVNLAVGHILVTFLTGKEIVPIDIMPFAAAAALLLTWSSEVKAELTGES